MSNVFLPLSFSCCIVGVLFDMEEVGKKAFFKFERMKRNEVPQKKRKSGKRGDCHSSSIYYTLMNSVDGGNGMSLLL
jgi:hypothetical protein